MRILALLVAATAILSGSPAMAGNQWGINGTIESDPIDFLIRALDSAIDSRNAVVHREPA
jgi:hypothetical protein